MRVSEKICIGLNRMFKVPVHPFNLSNDKKQSYAEWQYEKGINTIKFYLEKNTIDELFKDKVVLDVGCGAAGKTIFYASLGVKQIVGLEILEKYRKEANELAVEKGFENKFEFVCQDAAKMNFEDNYFDSIIMNDAMEHVDDPKGVIDECIRVLKPGGRIYANFPPYYHPYGAHLSDVIGFPWVHCFFSDRTLINVYKRLVMKKPDGKDRIKFRISKNKEGKEYFSYINKMTIKRFNKIVKDNGYHIHYYKEVPLRTTFKPLAKMPVMKEFFVKMVVCIIEK
jgi:ubiquinone/menaquinone biosynthesis C-methylase UbiE